MSRIALSALSASLIAVSGACGSSSGSSSSGVRKGMVTDTLGKVFSVSCSSSLFCTLTPQDSTLRPLSCDRDSQGTDAFVLVWGTTILAVHAVAVPTSGSVSLHAAEPAHPIACTTDADCLPDLLGGRHACASGLCQRNQDLLTIDVAALCQADIPWPISCPYDTNPLVVTRMAEVESLCGTSTECSNVPAVPADCRQPTTEDLCPVGAAPPGVSTPATCSPACTPDQECVGGACVPLSPWGGMTCSPTESCPSDARCCDGSDATCDGTRLPAGDGTNPGQFEVSTDGANVTDRITGLVWQRDSGDLICAWGVAKTYCETLSSGGLSGWRLPTPMELITIVDFTKAKPAIDRRAFPKTEGSFWTTADSFVIDFSDAGRSGFDTSGRARVRCVR